MEVRILKEQLEYILGQNPVVDSPRMVSMYTLLKTLNKDLGHFSIFGKQQKLVNSVNRDLLVRAKYGVGTISNLSFSYNLYDEEAWMDIKLTKGNPMLINYNKKDRVFASTDSLVGSNEAGLWEYLKKRCPDRIENEFKNFVAMARYFNLSVIENEFCDTTTELSHPFIGTDIVGKLDIDVKNGVKTDSVKGSIVLPETSQNIVHMSKDFDIKRTIDRNLNELLKRQGVEIDSLPPFYKTALTKRRK